MIRTHPHIYIYIYTPKFIFYNIFIYTHSYTKKYIMYKPSYSANGSLQLAMALTAFIGLQLGQRTPTVSFWYMKTMFHGFRFHAGTWIEEIWHTRAESWQHFWSACLLSKRHPKDHMEVRPHVYDNFKPMACQGLALSYSALHVFLACFKRTLFLSCAGSKNLIGTAVLWHVLDGLTPRISLHFSQERWFLECNHFPRLQSWVMMRLLSLQPCWNAVKSFARALGSNSPGFSGQLQPLMWKRGRWNATLFAPKALSSTLTVFVRWLNTTRELSWISMSYLPRPLWCFWSCCQWVAHEHNEKYHQNTL